MNDYNVISVDKATGKVSISPPFPPQEVSGKDKLVQIVVLALLNNSGRNVQYPELGAGLPSLIGQYNLDPEKPEEAFAEVSERIEKIKEEIISLQAGLENEEPSERLSDLILLNIENGVNIDDINVKLRLVSEGGDITNIVI